MDKLKENSQIPVNTRIIGTPGGIYVLYLEDYVHTFIKKLLEESTKKDNLYNSTDGIFFYGNRFEEDKRIILVVSGASNMDSVKNKTEKYFSEISLLGIAKVSLNKDLGIRIELDLDSGVKVILDDFYIYYDQNEEMQNYLIEWNIQHHTSFASVGNVREYFQKNTDYISNSNGTNTNYADIKQDNDKEQVKVGFIWNAMNVLSLGFVICVTVYGIVSINNFQKLQGIKEKVDYCMAVISENISVQSDSTQMQAYENKTKPVSSTENTEEQSLVSENPINENDIPDISETESVQNQSIPIQDEYNSEISNTQPVLEISTPQYYIVRKGDTLRTICFDVYGDYSKVNEVCKYNNIENPNDILYGQKLLLP